MVHTKEMEIISDMGGKKLEIFAKNSQFSGQKEILINSSEKSVADLNNNNGVTVEDSREIVAKPKTLSLSSINPFILTFRKMEYAARGPVIMRAVEIERELSQAQSEGKISEKPFDTIIKGNLGDAQAMTQNPITFLRQVMALISCPELMSHEGLFSTDVSRKVKELLAECRGKSIGSYTDPRGLSIVRQHCAQYIEKRDGGKIPANFEDVILTGGASDGIRASLKLFKSDGMGRNRSGVLCPIPQYPLYNATLGEYDMVEIGYYLSEEKGWSIEISELERALKEARAICNPRAICVINPGNPTGHVLTRVNMEEIIKFARRENLFILADEVYQENVYGQAEFLSFKRVLYEMGSPYNQMELISFFSASKGFACECAIRGGYMEICNLDPAVKSVLMATLAGKLCPNIMGQVAVDCIVCPPQKTEPSYDQFMGEKMRILQSLDRKAKMATKELNLIPGMKCSEIQGALYAYPRIFLPERSIIEAKKAGLEPDVFYAMELLEATGVCITPGSGVGQFPGTFHFRTTILPRETQLSEMLQKLKEFHLHFLEKFASL